MNISSKEETTKNNQEKQTFDSLISLIDFLNE
jgi:hypothetical protein